MLTLFENEIAFPPGFTYEPNFINADEEQKLIGTISSLALHPLIFQGFEAKRKVESYGYDYNFDKRTISKGKAIPGGLQWILEKVASHYHIPDFAEVLVTEYPPGSVINWHRDAPPFDIIVGISLLSDCIFRLRPYDKSKRDRKSTISFNAQRRSIYRMEGPARSDWEHSISPVKNTRYSITFRTLRKSSEVLKKS